MRQEARIATMAATTTIIFCCVLSLLCSMAAGQQPNLPSLSGYMAPEPVGFLDFVVDASSSSTLQPEWRQENVSSLAACAARCNSSSDCAGFSYATPTSAADAVNSNLGGICIPKPTTFFPFQQLPGLPGWSVVSYISLSIVGNVDGYRQTPSIGCFSNDYQMAVHTKIPDAWSCGEICNLTDSCKGFFYFPKEFVGNNADLTPRRKGGSTSTSGSRSTVVGRTTSSTSKSAQFYRFNAGDCVLKRSVNCGYQFSSTTEIRSYSKNSPSVSSSASPGKFAAMLNVLLVAGAATLVSSRFW